jgi:membrane-associated phospholipid phosphatase
MLSRGDTKEGACRYRVSGLASDWWLSLSVILTVLLFQSSAAAGQSRSCSHPLCTAELYNRIAGMDSAHGSEYASSINTNRTTEDQRCSNRLNYLSLFVKDGWHVLSFPIRWKGRDWQAATVAMLGVGAVATLDRPIRDGVRKRRSKGTDFVAKTFQPFGEWYGRYALGGYYLIGLVWDSPKARAVAFDGLVASHFAAPAITFAFKIALGRSRPYGSDDVYNFKPFSGHDSFPSGHATCAFAIASVFSAHYDQLWVKIVAYSVAGLVGFARMNYDVHYASDVFAGALIGTAVGYSVVKFNQRERNKRDPGGLLLTYDHDQDTFLMRVSFVFGR